MRGTPRRGTPRTSKPSTPPSRSIFSSSVILPRRDWTRCSTSSEDRWAGGLDDCASAGRTPRKRRQGTATAEQSSRIRLTFPDGPSIPDGPSPHLGRDSTGQTLPPWRDPCNAFLLHDLTAPAVLALGGKLVPTPCRSPCLGLQSPASCGPYSTPSAEEPPCAALCW